MGGIFSFPLSIAEFGGGSEPGSEKMVNEEPGSDASLKLLIIYGKIM
jgi:hypothetical protein